MSWPVLPLGDVAETALGKMLDTGKSKGHAHVPYLRNVNVQWGRIDTHDLRTMELADDERDRFAVQEGDLLVCEGGEIGRCAIWHGRSEYLAYQKALHRVRPSDRLDSRFLRYLLEHHAQTGSLARLATGSTIAHLPQQQLRRVRVPLPPLDEQRRIVDILEDHLSRIDAADAEIRRSLTKLRRLREAGLQSAITGAKPGSPTRTIGELGTVTSGLTPLRTNGRFHEGGTIPWLASGDLHQGTVLTARTWVTEHALRETSLKIVPAGAILVAMYGEGRTRGTAALLGIDATTNQACAAIQLRDSRLTSWVKVVLDSNYEAMRRLAAGGVQPNLNLSLVRAIRVPVPSAAYREAALDRLDELSEAEKQLRSALTTGQAHSSALRHSLLATAFSGRLTSGTSDLSVAEEMIGA